MSFFHKIKIIKEFLGEKTSSLFIKSAAVGILWFLIESSFIFIIQTFFVSLDLVDVTLTNLPLEYEYTPLITFTYLILFGFIRSIVIFLKNYLSGSLGQSIMNYHRDNILKYSFLNYSKINTSEISFIYNEITMSARELTLKLSNLFQSSVASLFFILLALILAPIELIISLIITSLLVYPLFLLDKKITVLNQEIYKISRDVNESLSRGLKNIFLLKAYEQINNEVNKGIELNKKYEKKHNLFYRIYSLRSAIPILIGITTISSVMFLSLKYFNGNGIKLISFFYIFIRLIICLTDFFTSTSEIKVRTKGLTKLLEIKRKLNFDKKNNKKISSNKKIITQSLDKTQNIQILNLSFAYNKNNILYNFNAQASTSTPLILKGASGTGKSTFLSLLLKINTPDSGEILINGHNIHKTTESFSNLLAYVGPEPFLIPNTVKENLLYFYPKKIDDDIDLKIYKTLKKVELYDDIIQLDKSINTFLNEQTQLSTGQKQRLSIARAILREPKILILDEATANIDHETEKKIIKSIDELKKQMTIIIVTHKNTFDHFSENIITL